LQKVIYFYITVYLSYYIGLVTVYIALHAAIGAYHHFGITGYVADNGAVNTEIIVAADVTFQGSVAPPPFVFSLLMSDFAFELNIGLHFYC
jgi:hypothetical protein